MVFTEMIHRRTARGAVKDRSTGRTRDTRGPDVRLSTRLGRGIYRNVEFVALLMALIKNQSRAPLWIDEMVYRHAMNRLTNLMKLANSGV